MSRISQNRKHGGWPRQLVTSAVLAIAAIAGAQSDGPRSLPLSGYFAHLSTPQLPEIRLLELTVGESVQDDSGRPTTIRPDRDLPIHLRLALTGTAVDRIGIRVRVSGTSGRAEQTYWMSTNEWRIGGAYDWTGIWRVPALTLVGHGTMAIGQLLPDPTGTPQVGNGTAIPVREAILFQGPVYAAPVSMVSRLRQVTVDSTFGPSVHRLGRAFRLAPDTSIQISVDLPKDEQCIGVGIISSLGGSFDFRQGDTIAVISRDTTKESLHLRAGVDTSFIDAAAPPPGVVAIAGVRVIASYAAPYVDWHDAPIDASLYGSSLRFGEPHNLNSLTFQYSAAHGYIDVHDVVCLLRRAIPDP